jgi:hypothetical protein
VLSSSSDDEFNAGRTTGDVGAGAAHGGKDSTNEDKVAPPKNKKNNASKSKLRLHVAVAHLELVLPRNSASVEATALLIDSAVIRNVMGLKVTRRPSQLFSDASRVTCSIIIIDLFT